MQPEIEAKWLNIDHKQMRAKLKACGATLMQPERLMARKILDFEDGSLGKVGGWVRVRSEGNKTTMSYKQLNDLTIEGTKEVTVTVDDFDNTCQFLESIGLRTKSYQETKRESWKLNSAEIELDTWPWIPTFIEIEASDEATLRQTAEMLELDFTQALHGSVETAYQDVYNVTEAEVNSWQEITFIDIPDWLEVKRK